MLAAHPDQSRAVFRLGQLAAPGSAEAIRRFHQYVELEPSDPWGYMALGDALARARDVDSALQQYGQARRLAPTEPDVVAGTARILQDDGRFDALIALYEAYTEQRPGDAAAWVEFGRARQRAARHAEAAWVYARAHSLTPESHTLERLDAALAQAAPSLRAYLGSGRDSDDNRIVRGGLELLLPAGDRARLGARMERAEVSDVRASSTAGIFALVGTWAPRHAARLEAAGGVTRLARPGGAADYRALGQLRMRWRESHGSPAVDLQVIRRSLLATPALLAAPVYALPPLAIAVDAGIGAQRVTRFTGPAQGWQGTLRAWTSFSWDLQPGVQLALEIDFENSLAATTATATGEDWRSLTALLSVRYGVLRRSAQQVLSEARRSR